MYVIGDDVWYITSDNMGKFSIQETTYSGLMNSFKTKDQAQRALDEILAICSEVRNQL